MIRIPYQSNEKQNSSYHGIGILPFVASGDDAKNFTKSIAIGFNEYWFVGLQGK